MTVISATLKCLRCKAPLPYAEVSIYVPFCAPCWSGIIAGVGKAFGDAFQEFKTQLDRVIERQREELRLAIEEGRIHDAVYVRAEETEEPDIAGAGQGPRPGSLELRSNIPLPPVEIERVMAEKHITELEYETEWISREVGLVRFVDFPAEAPRSDSGTRNRMHDVKESIRNATEALGIVVMAQKATEIAQRNMEASSHTAIIAASSIMTALAIHRINLMTTEGKDNLIGILNSCGVKEEWWAQLADVFKGMVGNEGLLAANPEWEEEARIEAEIFRAFKEWLRDPLARGGPSPDPVAAKQYTDQRGLAAFIDKSRAKKGLPPIFTKDEFGNLPTWKWKSKKPVEPEGEPEETAPARTLTRAQQVARPKAHQ